MHAAYLPRLLFRLSVGATRAKAAAELAAYLGVEEALLFAMDPATEVMIPAAGMVRTVRGGRAWRTFLATLVRDGEFTATVDLPATQLRLATAYVSHGAALVLLGGCVNEARVDELPALLPLLASTLQIEQRLLIAQAESAAASGLAERANSLTISLERARSESSQLNIQLRQEDLAKDEFLATLAHELRNPLSGVRASVALLSRDNIGDSVKAAAVASIDRQSRHLARLVDDLLDAARIRHGLVTLQLEPVELRGVLAEAAEFNGHAAEAKNHQVDLQLCEEPLIVLGDPARLLQVFTNLFLNACKYTNAGGRITLSAYRSGPHAVVSFTDTGIGIAPNMLPTVFELFTQVPVALKQSQGGLGIGLSLVKRLVDLHQGTINAKSDGSARGSTFTVTLPLCSQPT